jgi:hypothetical protein
LTTIYTRICSRIMLYSRVRVQENTYERNELDSRNPPSPEECEGTTVPVRVVVLVVCVCYSYLPPAFRKILGSWGSVIFTMWILLYCFYLRASLGPFLTGYHNFGSTVVYYLTSLFENQSFLTRTGWFLPRREF